MKINIERISLGFMVAAMCVSGCATANRDWQKTDHLGTINAYEVFLNRHSDAEQAPLARQRIAALRCDQAWKRALSLDSISSYEEFLANFPGSRYDTEAKANLRPNKEWEHVSQVRTIAACEDFLKKHPTFKKTSEVKRLITSLESERDWTAAEKANSVDSYLQFIKQYPSTVLATNAASRLGNLLAEVDWKTALATDTEAAWLDYILRHWTSDRVNDAVARFQTCEKAGPHRSLTISAIDPSFTLGSMMVRADVTTSGQSSVPFTPVARASVYDGKTKEISVETQGMKAETPGAFTVRPGSTGMLFCVAGSPSVWTGPKYTHYSGHGVVCVYAIPESSPNSDLSGRISNLVIIDADFSKEVAKVLTGSQVTKNDKK